MNTKPVPVDFPEVQTAIYGVALSLDAFLVNGIQYGVLQRAVFTGFLQKTASTLLKDLAILEEQAAHASITHEAKVTEALAALRARCQQLIDLVTELNSFRDLPPQLLRSTISRVLLLRQECVELIQELEAQFRTPEPFYQSRPCYSTDAVNDFLGNLQRVFAEAWAAGR